MNRYAIRLLPIALAIAYALYKFLAAPTFVNPETGSKHRLGMNPQQEQTLGLQSYQQVLQQEQGNVITEGQEVQTVREIARRLASAASEKSDTQYNWQLSVVRSNQVNAFCLPGGEIVVYTAILPVAQNPAGLATVLGHEMAHATSHHGARRMLQQNLLQTILSGAQFSMGNMDWNQQQAVMGALGAATKYGAIQRYNRGDESEADHIGLLYMARAGYDPHEALNFWQRMQQNNQGGQPPQFMSDHPSDGVRIQQLQDWMPEAEKEYANSKMRSTNAPTKSTGM